MSEQRRYWRVKDSEAVRHFVSPESITPEAYDEFTAIIAETRALIVFEDCLVAYIQEEKKDEKDEWL